LRIALLDPFAGVAGDMLVGALLDAGASLAAVRRAVAALGIRGVSLSRRSVDRAGLRATKFSVRRPARGHEHRGLREVLRLFRKLPAAVRARSESAFRALARAEAEIHGCSPDEVRFHEVGAVDSIADVVGAAAALEDLAVETLYCGPLPWSRGVVETEHGPMPLPAPATASLLRGWAVRDFGFEGELVTPTGAACVAAWARPAPAPAFVPVASGYGAGDRDPDAYPNVCRVTLGDVVSPRPGALLELVCDVDDVSPQSLAHLLDRLLAEGALDATLQPVVMKKGRLGTRVTALAEAAIAPRLEETLFIEGATLGVRRHSVERTALPRRFVVVRTPYGAVRVKVAEFRGRRVRAAPEYEDCRALAERRRVPLAEVVAAALSVLPRGE
jgi:uncharacterized protein (TIGR00299 family) protein